MKHPYVGHREREKQRGQISAVQTPNQEDKSDQTINALPLLHPKANAEQEPVEGEPVGEEPMGEELMGEGAGLGGADQNQG